MVLPELASPTTDLGGDGLELGEAAAPEGPAVRRLAGDEGGREGVRRRLEGLEVRDRRLGQV